MASNPKEIATVDVAGGASRFTAPRKLSPRQPSRSGGRPEARHVSTPILGAPRADSSRASETGEANRGTKTSLHSPPPTNSGSGRKPQAKVRPTPTDAAPAAPHPASAGSGEGQLSRDTQVGFALAGNTPGGPPPPPAPPGGGDQDDPEDPIRRVLKDLKVAKRVYDDLRRAKQRVLLQAMSICRSYCEGDKAAGAKLWARKDKPEALAATLLPYIAAMEPLEQAIATQERFVEKLGKKLPCQDWLASHPGVGPRFYALIVGSLAGFAPSDYRGPACLWKRMGLAVIDGERQRRKKGSEAIAQGFNAENLSLMWNIGDSIIKAQLRSEKDEKGDKIPGTDYAIGELGQAYLDRKAYITAKNEAGDYAHRAEKAVKAAKANGSEPNKANLEGKLTGIHLHNDAKRYIEKRLLRELWKAWRRAISASDPTSRTPAANPPEASA